MARRPVSPEARDLSIWGNLVGAAGITSALIGGFVEKLVVQQGLVQTFWKNTIEGSQAINAQSFALALIVAGLIALPLGALLSMPGNVPKKK